MNNNINYYPKFSVIIPCYNEAMNIPFLFENIVIGFHGKLSEIEIILVDNGSTDNSKSVMKKELLKHPNLNCKIIRIEKNLGYGHGIVTGLREATTDILSWTHADLQTDMNDVYRAYQVFSSQSNPQRVFLKGSRRERPIIDAAFTMGMSGLSSLLLKTKLSDINAQPKMFHRDFFNQLTNFPNDFSLDLYFYLMAQTNHFDILTIPVFYKKRLLGEAKGGGSLKNKLKLTKRTFSYILKLNKKLKRAA